MTEWMSKAIAWLRSVYSEADGTGSSTRVHVGILVLFVVVVGSIFEHLVSHKVMTSDQFDAFLVSAGTFLATSCGVLYGSNKLADVFKKKEDGR
jgi:hypothetical protein